MASNRINISTSIALVAFLLFCYIILGILFLAPGILHPSVLIFVQDPSRITPFVVVGLLAASLSSATIAFTTRCADHSLWLNHLAPVDGGAVRQPATVKETRRMAEWTVSSLGRFKYIFAGRSIPLKLSGLLLFATTAAVGPVLLSGISQRNRSQTEWIGSAHSVDVWTPWITTANSRSRGGSANDVPILSAVLASNDNLSLPAAPVCNDTKSGDTCSVQTRSAALFATCTPRTLPNDGKIASTVCTSDDESDQVQNYCSTIVPTMCVNLTCGSPSVYANFLTGPDPSCVIPRGQSNSPKECNTIPGTWATILGVWVGGVDIGIGNQDVINIVDCKLEYGNVTLHQAGGRPPIIDRETFEKSTYLLSDYASPISNVRTFAWREFVFKTPYYFTLRTVGNGWNDIYDSAVASGLLGADASNSAEHVARQIERNFDWATLAAFAKRPDASDYTTIKTTNTRMYIYDHRVLGILLAPLFATVLAALGRLRVGSDDQVLGYDPIAIAQRGPSLVAGIYEKPENVVYGRDIELPSR